jgi:arabinofuranosyltransferase
MTLSAQDEVGGAPGALVVGLCALVCLAAVVVTAWLSDDAFISFRCAIHLVDGHGLTFNPGVRAQAFTNPLWTLLFAGAYALTEEVYFTAIGMSLLTAAAALWGLSRGASSWQGAALGLTLLTLSRAFVEHSTSGLETGMSCALLALWAARREHDGPTPWLAVSLLLLNRMDLVLIVAPSMAAWLWTRRDTPRAALFAVALGLAPFALWELFALVYYGFPFPNTAYAKLGGGVEAGELWASGLYYLLHTLRMDPVTGVGLFLGPLAALTIGARRERWLAVGTLLYIVYVLRVGGDFMSGRLFVPPLFVAATLLTRLPQPSWAAGGLVGLVVVGALAPWRPFGESGVRPGEVLKKDTERALLLDANQITDERAFYFHSTALITATRGEPMPRRALVVKGEALRRQAERSGGRLVVVRSALGLQGVAAGPSVHLVDTFGLADPLLARLPAAKFWRVGHVERVIPEGYVESLRTGKNQLADKDLAEYYDRLSLVVSGPIWSGARLYEILRFNVGGNDALIDVATYQRPPIRTLPLAALTEPLALTYSGVALGLDAPSHAQAIEVEMSCEWTTQSGQLVLQLGDKVVGRVKLESQDCEGAPQRLVVPVEASARGFDQLILRPTAISGLRLLRLSLLDEGDDGV